MWKVSCQNDHILLSIDVTLYILYFIWNGESQREKGNPHRELLHISLLLSLCNRFEFHSTLDIFLVGFFAGFEVVSGMSCESSSKKRRLGF